MGARVEAHGRQTEVGTGWGAGEGEILAERHCLEALRDEQDVGGQRADGDVCRAGGAKAGGGSLNHSPCKGESERHPDTHRGRPVHVMWLCE